MKRKFVCHNERNGAVWLFKGVSLLLEDNWQGVLKCPPGTTNKNWCCFGTYFQPNGVTQVGADLPVRSRQMKNISGKCNAIQFHFSFSQCPPSFLPIVIVLLSSSHCYLNNNIQERETSQLLSNRL